MTNPLKQIADDVTRTRREITRLQDDLADMLDHLLVIEARAKAAGEKLHTTAEVERALGL